MFKKLMFAAVPVLMLAGTTFADDAALTIDASTIVDTAITSPNGARITVRRHQVRRSAVGIDNADRRRYGRFLSQLSIVDGTEPATPNGSWFRIMSGSALAAGNCLDGVLQKLPVSTRLRSGKPSDISPRTAAERRCFSLADCHMEYCRT